MTDADAERHQRKELRRLTAIAGLQGLVTNNVTDSGLIEEIALEALEGGHARTITCVVPLAIDALQRRNATADAQALRSRWLDWRAAHPSPVRELQRIGDRRDAKRRELQRSYSLLLHAHGYKAAPPAGEIVFGSGLGAQI